MVTLAIIDLLCCQAYLAAPKNNVLQYAFTSCVTRMTSSNTSRIGLNNMKNLLLIPLGKCDIQVHFDRILKTCSSLISKKP